MIGNVTTLLNVLDANPARKENADRQKVLDRLMKAGVKPG